MQIAFRFETPTSLIAGYHATQPLIPVPSMASMGHRLISMSHDEVKKAKVSGNIPEIVVEFEGKNEADEKWSWKWSGLEQPQTQIPLFGYFLMSRCYIAWMGIGQSGIGRQVEPQKIIIPIGLDVARFKIKGE